MRKTLVRVSVFFAITLLCQYAASAQAGSWETSGLNCEGRIYNRNELESPAVIVLRPRAELTAEALSHGVRGQILIKAVLCRSGEVTDIQVVKGLPYGMTEKAVESISRMKFTPARIAGKPVSQAQNFEFKFSYIGEPRPVATGKLDNRVIDSVLIEGPSQSMSGQIKECLNLLSGSVYNKELIEQVYQRLLRLENFDSKTSTVRVEESDRGGLAIVYLLRK